MHQTQIVEPAEQNWIGDAYMTDDETIVLNLLARDGGVIGVGRFVYAKSHPQYAEVLRHLDGLKPGQTKLVPPWP